MSVITKALVTCGTLGIVGGGSYAATYLLSDNSPKSINQKETKNISNQLAVDGYTIMEDSDGNWTDVFAQYQLVSGGNSDLKFTGITINSKESLRSQCKTILALSSSDINSYKRGAKWCTVPRDMKDMLQSKGYRFLSTVNGTDNIDQNLWNANIRKHNNKAENADKKFTFAGKSDNQLTESPEDRNLIRDMCRPLETKKHYEQNFEADLEKAKLWCSALN